jgi:small-conductance mechanosensitive channel
MPLTNLIGDLLDDLSRPGMPWQIGSIIASVLIGLLVTRLVRGWWQRRRGVADAAHTGVDSFARVVMPLLVVALLSLAQFVLHKYRFNTNIVKVAIPIFWSLALIRLAFYLVRRVFARRGQLAETFVTFEKVFVLLVWLAVVLYITGLWPDVVEFLGSYRLQYGPKKNDFVSVDDLLQGIITIAVMLMLALWAGTALEERLMGMTALHSSLRVALARVGRAVLIVGAVLASLRWVGIDLTVLSVFGGALGVGLGLGMQRIASNYVSGFIILMERSLSIGDMISVTNFTGKVTQINTRYTVLQGLDGVETVVPNEMLISGTVQNQSLSNRRVRAGTKVTVAYGSDLDVVMPLLIAQAASNPRVLEEPAPGCSLARFGPDGYELDLGFWIADPENGQGGVASDINKKIYALVSSGQVKLGYPSLDTRLLDSHIASAVARITKSADEPASSAD